LQSSKREQVVNQSEPDLSSSKDVKRHPWLWYLAGISVPALVYLYLLATGHSDSTLVGTYSASDRFWWNIFPYFYTSPLSVVCLGLGLVEHIRWKDWQQRFTARAVILIAAALFWVWVQLHLL
jgi:hypothetical protein